MSLSYVVPVWREDVYLRVAAPWIQEQIDKHGGQLIEVRGCKSIFDAVEQGRKHAKNRYIMYVHDDVQLLSTINLAEEVNRTFGSFKKLGLIGPAGKIQKKRVPWWLNAGNYVGHWCRRGNRNQLVYQYANTTGMAPFRDVAGDPYEDWKRQAVKWDQFHEAGLVDGFYLIEDSTRMIQPWDTKTYGEQWHGYDVDRCYQAHAMGLKIMVTPWLFLHDNAGHAGYKGTDPAKYNGVDQANRRINSVGDAVWLSDLDVTNQLVRAKWGVG
jgi:hypothetical protein